MVKVKIRLEFSKLGQAKTHNETYDYNTKSYKAIKKAIKKP